MQHVLHQLENFIELMNVLQSKEAAEIFRGQELIISINFLLEWILHLKYI